MTQTQRGATTTGADTLRITEIFTSIQGEGTRVGRPCTFVRLTGCDIRCRWCDTAYAFTGGTRMALDDVVAEVAGRRCPLVCVTGGEPLVQRGVLALMSRLADAGHEVILETGGHRDISGVDPRVVRIVDLKAPGSRESGRNRWANLAALRHTDEVKIVLTGRADYDWAREVLERHGLGVRVTVLLSPVHGELDPETLAGWMIEDRLPARLQIQLHKVIWGADARGV